MKKTFLDLRIVVLAVGLIGLVVLRQLIQSFGVSLGYLYITLISLAGFWFGVRGANRRASRRFNLYIGA